MFVIKFHQTHNLFQWFLNISGPYGTGTERVRVGPSGRSAVGQFFRRTIFQKIRIRDFFEKCFKRDGTERVGTERVGRVGNPLVRQSLE